MDGDEVTAQKRLNRLSEKHILPLVRSKKMQGCALYWLPVYTEPLVWREKQWLMAFFDALDAILEKKYGLRQESFLQMKLVAPMGAPKDLLHANQAELMPMMGLSRKPGAKLPPIPTEEDLKPVMEGKQKFQFNDYVGDYVMWFLTRKERFRRDLFLGYGGYTMMYLAPDPATEPPPLPDYPAFNEHPAIKNYDVRGLWDTVHLLTDGFGAKSKAVFGKGFEEEPSFEGIPFIIPLMNAREYQDANPDDIAAMFTVFDVYIQESSSDTGILIASKLDLDDDLHEVLESLRAAGIEHPSAPKESAYAVQS